VKEFAIIENFFKSRSHQRKDVLLGIGDDCALTTLPEGQALAITTDTLVSGVHFLEGTCGRAVAHKAVTANLSDLAAMGAEPAWLSLSLSLPEANEPWLTEFADALQELTEYYSVQLIGGDTVQGPLSVTITAQGFVPPEQAMTRSKAKPGDLLYVTGTLGDAGLGLELLQNSVTLNKELSPEHKEFLLNRYYYPSPRVLAGTSLRRAANACIDISDGLIADLGHILKASHCGATLQLDKLPLSAAMQQAMDSEQAIRYALTAGDDYELLFTVSAEQKGNLDITLANLNVNATCIGQLNGMDGKLTLQYDKQPYAFVGKGYEHF
jgi:thiamine-monophosphate kinase